MQTTTLKPFCNITIDLRYEFQPEAPMTFIFSSGYGIFNFEEPVQVALTELLSKYRINWVQFLYPERNQSNAFGDLYISTGLLSLSEVYAWVKKQASSPIGLFGISFGGNISIELALKETLHTLIIINAVFDYVDFRSKQIGADAMEAWQNTFVTKLSYQHKKLPLCYRFIQEAERQKLEERAKKVNCDVYAFQGDCDPIISPKHIQELSAQTSNWHAKIISGGDHVFDKKPIIDEFIKEIEPVIKLISERHSSI
jgi:alpha/beta superfamily hydrolase